MSGYRRRGARRRPPHRETIPERHVRSRWSLPIFAVASTLALVVASVASPDGPVFAHAVAPASVPDAQVLAVGTDHDQEVNRDDYRVSRFSTAPAVGIPDPGSAKAFAYQLVLDRGWDQGEYECLVALWERESHWNVYAHNPTSGAYGIPQALPGSKMASAGADWATNAETQISWGIGYIADRYGTPCAAWQSSETRGWY